MVTRGSWTVHRSVLFGPLQKPSYRIHTSGPGPSSQLLLMAKGLRGEERVRFKFGGTLGASADSLFPARWTEMITLTTQYQRIELPLDRDLSRISAGLIRVGEHAMGAGTIFLDDIRIEGGSR